MRYCMKMFLALIAAVLVANGFCCIYYNVERDITNNDAYTIKKSMPNELTAYGVEGFSLKRTDKYGFYNDGAVVPDNANVVCIGSSQTAAIQVSEDESYVARLRDNSANLNVYNLGVGGQYIQESLPRMPLIPKYFTAVKTIVLETPTLPTIDEWHAMKMAIKSGKVSVENLDWKEQNIVFSLLRRVPLFRILRKQIKDLGKSRDTTIREKKEHKRIVTPDEYQQAAEETLAVLRSEMGDIRIIIVYLPQVKLEKNGEMSIIADREKILALENACANNGIEYVNMCPVYSREYATERVVPYGHFNSQIASGHLNAEGHRLVANALRDKFAGKVLNQ